MTSNLAYNVSLDDGNPQIAYAGNWQVAQEGAVAPGNPSGATQTNFFGGSIHATTTNGSSARLVFTGVAIYYFADVDVGDHGLATITLDGQNTIITSADNGGYRGQVLLFSSTGLANTSHSFIVTKTDMDGLLTTIDQIIYTAEHYILNTEPLSQSLSSPSTTPSIASSTSPFPSLAKSLSLSTSVSPSTSFSLASTSPSPSASPSPSTPSTSPLLSTTNSKSPWSTTAATAVGLAVGGVVLLGLLFVCWQRRRRDIYKKPEPVGGDSVEQPVLHAFSAPVAVRSHQAVVPHASSTDEFSHMREISQSPPPEYTDGRDEFPTTANMTVLQQLRPAGVMTTSSPGPASFTRKGAGRGGSPS